MFDQLLFWHWLIIGALLIGAELLTPGVFLLWLGISALLTGGVMAIWPDLDWRYALILFGGLSIVSIVVALRIRRIRAPKSDLPYLNKRALQYLGRRVTLDEPIVDGRGTVKLDDTRWRVSGPDLPAGAHVVISGAEGATLTVEPFIADPPKAETTPETAP
jgi:membrane protein implicated in regulation of membrane protease activity